MNPLAAAERSSSSLITFILVGSLVFGFGVAWATMKRAYADHQGAKGGAKETRKTLLDAVWKTIKFALVVLVVGIALVAWVVSDTRPEPAPRPAPAAT